MLTTRLTAVLTHPVQYYAPWFRYISAHAPELELTVLYGTEPTPEQQGVGFGKPFQWDVPLTEGYRSTTVRKARRGDRVDSESFFGLNVQEIDEALEQTHPDVVLVPGWYSITLVRALMSARRHHVPVLFRGDTNLNSGPRRGWQRALWRARSRFLLSWFDGYLCPGTLTREYLESMGVDRSRIAMVPHAIDNAFFADAARPFQSRVERAAARDGFGLTADGFVMLFVGKLDEVKRPLDVIRAASRLSPRASVLMVGGGQLEKECREEAEKLGVAAVFTGFLNQSALGKAYACADVLVLPSASETWGLVVNEALACGRPVVASSAVGCVPDLVDSQTGDTFACGDIDALAAAVARVRARASIHRYSEACRTRVSRFDFAAATTGLIHACRQAMSDRRVHAALPLPSGNKEAAR